jgi:quercetin dioxygenase-like cupin family protein
VSPLPKHGWLGPSVENARHRIEAERVKLVEAAPNRHSILLANFSEQIHDFPLRTADVAQALAEIST